MSEGWGNVIQPSQETSQSFLRQLNPDPQGFVCKGPLYHRFQNKAREILTCFLRCKFLRDIFFAVQILKKISVQNIV